MLVRKLLEWMDGPSEIYVGKVKNLIIENATVIGYTNVGCIAGGTQRIGFITRQVLQKDIRLRMYR